MNSFPLIQLIVGFAVLAATRLPGAEPTEILLWPQGAPGSEGKTAPELSATNTNGEQTVWRVHRPSLTPYLPAREKANGSAMLVIPGGGHRVLAITHEG